MGTPVHLEWVLYDTIKGIPEQVEEVKMSETNTSNKTAQNCLR
jgi:hypothetical protein